MTQGAPLELVGLTLKHETGARRRLLRHEARDVAEGLDFVLFRGLRRLDIHGLTLGVNAARDRIVVDGMPTFPCSALTRAEAVSLGIALARAAHFAGEWRVVA